MHQGVQELLVKCITEESPPQLKWPLLQGHFQFCVMQFYSVHPALSVRPSIGRLIGWLVSWSPLNFLAFLSFLSSLLLPKCPSDLFSHCSCPFACNWGSRVSGLVLSHAHVSMVCQLVGRSVFREIVSICRNVILSSTNCVIIK